MGQRRKPSRTKPLTAKQDMALIAASLKAPDMLAMLEALPPAQRKLMGRSIERTRRSFADAYPGQTRTRRHTNRTWEQAGHADIAALNRLLGLRSA